MNAGSFAGLEIITEAVTALQSAKFALRKGGCDFAIIDMAAATPRDLNHFLLTASGSGAVKLPMMFLAIEAGSSDDEDEDYRTAKRIVDDYSLAGIVRKKAVGSSLHEVFAQYVGDPRESTVSSLALLQSQNKPNYAPGSRREEESPTFKRLAAKIDVAASLGDKDAHRAAVKSFFAFHPSSPRALLEMASITFEEGDAASALSLANKALSLRPNDLRCLNLKSRIQLALGQSAEALQTMKAANILNPENIERMIVIGETLRKAGRLDEAFEAFTDAAGRAPDDIRATGGILNTLSDMGIDAGATAEAALQSREKVNLANPKEVLATFNAAGVAMAKTGNVNGAKKLYETAGKMASDEREKAIIEFNLSILAERAGNIREASEKARLALSIDPSFEKAKSRLDRLQGAAGR